MPWPLEKDFLLSLGMAEELPVLWSTLRLCAECFKSNAEVVCRDCHCVCYCSEECQSDHTAAHSGICAKLAKIQFAEWDDLELKGPALILEGVPAKDEGNEEKDATTDTCTTTTTKISSEDIMMLTRQCLQKEVNPSELDLPDAPQTLEDAEDLLHQIASSGHKDAQFGMPLLAAAKPQEQQEALEWTRRAAHNGLADAQVRYAMKYWLDGTADHKVDFIQAILWLRRALAQGRSGLSEQAFMKATNLTRMMANEYYNTLNKLDMKERGIGFQREMKLVAECGIVAAINIVWLVHSKGDWYETFFAQVEREKVAAS